MFDTNQLTLLDGAMGTMLQQSGLKPGELPELWSLTHPDRLAEIHRQYIAAGSRVIYANTFGANPRKLAGTGYTVAEAVTAAVAVARQAAAGTGCLVAIDIGPLGELLEPMGTLTFEKAMEAFREIAEAGARAGADLAVIETMTDLYEAKAALLAVKEHTDLPTVVTMTFDEGGRTFTGCTVASMAHTLTGLGADAIGLNCSLGPRQVLPMIRELAAHIHLPIVAKPNAGLPDPIDGHYDLTPEEFAKAMAEVVAAGASLVGGCCGTNPAYIRALSRAVEGVRPNRPAYIPSSFICTPTVPLSLDRVRIIGERINPTGKKRFQQALLAGDMDYIVDVAIQQMDAGAEVLDVNVGYPGVDETVMLPRVVKCLQAAMDLPLQLDSTNPAALEAALRVYNGKPAVNSVSGKPESLRDILPLVKKYGAAVVGLTLDEAGLPRTAEERLAIAERIVTAAENMGIPREDVWIDCLTLTVSAQQDQAAETLRALTLVRERLGLPTVLGVSNISFGLPNRLLMTTIFLTEALRAGLMLPIVNPNQRDVMDAIAAHRVLCGEDENCRGYVARFAQEKAAVPAPQGMDISLEEAIRRGLREQASAQAKVRLKSAPPLSLVETCLIPVLDQVGADYEAGRVFLPQLLASAQAAQAVFGVIRDAMAASGAQPIKKGRMIIATVQGDIHDIGKNIVRTVLENYGYEVVDLGRDVPPEVIRDTALRENIRLVGLSALMTTTLPAMEATVRLLQALTEPPVIMVGGAVVTPDYAAGLGVLYARDAQDSARIARSVLG